MNTINQQTGQDHSWRT